MEETDQTPRQKASPQVDVVSRLDVVSGPTGRRRWSTEAKARIVAESYAPGVSVSAVARRHGLGANQLFAWRRKAREGLLALPAAFEGFVPAMVEVSLPPPRGAVEIETGGVVVRLPGDTPAVRIGEIVSALRSGR